MQGKIVTVLTGLLVLFQFGTAQIKMEGMGRAASGGKPTARIAFFVGEVAVQKAATGQMVKAYINLTLDTGDKIITQAESRVEIDLNEVDVLKLAENAEVVLTEIVIDDPKQDPVTVNHTAGKILMVVKKMIGRQEVTITSPTSVAAVRGTTVGQELLNDGSTKVICLDGSVYVENIMFKGKGFTVKNGQWSQVRQSQVPLMPKDLVGDDLNGWKQWAEERQGSLEPAGSNLAGIDRADNAEPTTPVSPSESDEELETRPTDAAATPTPSPAPGKPEGAVAEAPADQPAADEGPKDKFSMGGAAGTYTDDEGNQVTYISLRPEIPIWKFGIALDVQLGFVMQEGGGMVFNKGDWDEPGDIIDKIYYVRFGKQNDPLYIRVGALPPITLGYGLIMNGYSNTIEYPDNKRIGVQLGVRKGKVGLNAVLNSVRELGNKNRGGMIGTRLSLRAHRFLEFGVTYAGDLNQYANLKDTDEDGRPDYLDKFPEDDEEWLDTDDDGIPDGTDNDRDGDDRIDLIDTLANDASFTGRLDQYGYGWEHVDSADQDPEPFNLDTVSDDNKMVHVIGGDVGIPVINTKFLQLLIYAQVAKILGVEDGGLGIAAPGAKFAIGPLQLMAEYRIFQDKFISNYFDELYELQRVTVSSTSGTADPVTKKTSLETVMAMNGVYAQLGLDILKMVILTASYEDLRRSDDKDKDKTLYAQLDLNTKLVPKLSRATAYYKLSHVVDFSNWKQEGAILGYKLGYELSPGTSLIFVYQETYNDTDGDGKIQKDEVDRRTGIETAFTF